MLRISMSHRALATRALFRMRQVADTGVFPDGGSSAPSNATGRRITHMGTSH